MDNILLNLNNYTLHTLIYHTQPHSIIIVNIIQSESRAESALAKVIYKGAVIIYIEEGREKRRGSQGYFRLARGKGQTFL